MKTDIIKDKWFIITIIAVYVINLVFGVYGYSASQEWGVWIYPFQHTSIILLVANYLVWRYPAGVLEQVFNTRLSAYIFTYLIAVVAACFDLLIFDNEKETVGLSGMVCAAWGLDLALRYFGIVKSLEPDKERAYIYAIIVALAIGFIIPNVNAFNHLISFSLSWIFVSAIYWLRTKRG